MTLTRLQDTTAEIRVRAAVVLLVAFVALAERFGLESILGAFLAGAVVGIARQEHRSRTRTSGSSSRRSATASSSRSSS